MDAKRRADFINSVAKEQQVPCPKCNTLNRSGAAFCKTCGAPLEKKDAGQAPAQAAFAPANKETQKPASKPASKPVSKPAVHYDEPDNVFAEGLPEWTVEPPMVAVRRKKK